MESVLTNEFALSKSLIRRLKRRETGILLNGARAYTTARVRAGDVLSAEIGDAAANAVRPIGMPLAIVYEDEDLLVIDKPAGLPVHPTQNPDEMTLEHALAAYLQPDEGVHPVSRLDRGTTGLMAVAKNGYMHELLRRRLHTDAYFREYRGVCVGELVPRAGQIVLSPDFIIGEHMIHRAVAHAVENAQHAAIPGRLADGHVGVLKAVAGHVVRREGIGLRLHGGAGGADVLKEVEQIQAAAHCQRRAGQADDQRQGNCQYAKRTFYHSILLHNVFQRAAHGVVKRRVHGRKRPFQPLTVVFMLHGSSLLRQVIAQQCFGAA